MSVNQLSERNFILAGKNTKSLNINIPGNVLVFFEMNGCQGCKAFKGIFNQLATENLVNCAIINVSNFPRVVEMSRQSNVPITKVPSLILYINGVPKAKYNGNKNIPMIKNFIQQILNKQQMNTTNVPQRSSMYGLQQPKRQVYQPEVRNRMNTTRGPVAGGYTIMNNQDDEDDDDERLAIPSNIIPHNTPWDSEYKKMNGN